MKTFIVLTFGFLGLAFYELSGGADFEPASARVAHSAPAETKAAPLPAPIQVRAEAQQTAPATITPDENAATVTRVSLNLTTLSETTPPTAAEPEATVKPQPAALSAGSVTSSDETPQIILPSLIATAPQPGAVPADDIRTVSGNRVNVRGGPSTDYSVVGKLSRGDAVRILEDNGGGWVLMQSLESGEEGWMADFLLTAG